MSKLALLTLLAAGLSTPAGAQPAPPTCPAPKAKAAASTGRAMLRVVAVRQGAVVTVCGSLTPPDAARRVAVVVRKAGSELASARRMLSSTGRFSIRIALPADVGPVRVVVTAGNLQLSRTLA